MCHVEMNKIAQLQYIALAIVLEQTKTNSLEKSQPGRSSRAFSRPAAVIP